MKVEGTSWDEQGDSKRRGDKTVMGDYQYTHVCSYNEAYFIGII